MATYYLVSGTGSSSAFSSTESTTYVTSSGSDLIWIDGIAWDQGGTGSATAASTITISTSCDTTTTVATSTTANNNTSRHPRRLTPAEEIRLEDLGRERSELARQQKSAQDKARELLMSHLTAEQQKTVRDNGWFLVKGGRSKKQYRINTHHGPAGNIDELQDNKRVARICCHADYGAIPNHDQFLAQKLMLEADEEVFLKIANRSRVA